jgi:hypothetical protein
VVTELGRMVDFDWTVMDLSFKRHGRISAGEGIGVLWRRPVPPPA